ncbi:hypothetical protein [Streptomyces sp. CB01373]|uniref:hypothetical protein n=1 Tax=Streptomyces sp. CB01373 TaxID=2020325 RepID=UPI000C275D1B|nr:hypothetical protein [Streptomyces sp. CB01373]PJM91451.1 hypothetical protein CG719_33880 [Streptomyces sp. CB01373]
MSVSWNWAIDHTPGEVELAQELPGLPPDSAGQRLAELRERAAGGDPAHLRRYALALSLRGQPELAAREWADLTRLQPSSLPVWFNLAFARVLCDRPEGAADALRRAREAFAHHPEAVALIDARARELQGARGRAAQTLRLQELQIAALRERLAAGCGEAGDRLRLTGLLRTVMLSPGGNVTVDEVLAAARTAHAEAPSDAAVLELLVLVLTQAQLVEEQTEALRKLEETAPHSDVLARLRELSRRNPSFESDVDAFTSRTRDLIGRTIEGDPEAEAEIRDRLRQYPDATEYRIGLIAALDSRGERAEALRAAQALAADRDGDHYAHFHLTQFFWHRGDLAEARRHCVRAVQTAPTAQDREEVGVMLRVVGAEALITGVAGDA